MARKSKVFIQGVQVTSDHLGQEIVFHPDGIKERINNPYKGITGHIKGVESQKGKIMLCFEHHNQWVEKDQHLTWKNPSILEGFFLDQSISKKCFIRSKYHIFKGDKPSKLKFNESIVLVFHSLDQSGPSRASIEWKELPPHWDIPPGWSVCFGPSGFDLIHYSKVMDTLEPLSRKASEPEVVLNLMMAGWIDATAYYHGSSEQVKTYQIPDRMAVYYDWLETYLVNDHHDDEIERAGNYSGNPFPKET